MGVTAIGTGGRRYARAFVTEERFPFPVLLDEEAAAAQIIGTRTMGAGTVMRPAAIRAAGKALFSGNRQHKTGARPLQLGATIVIGPGDRILFADHEEYAGDHADLDRVLDAAT